MPLEIHQILHERVAFGPIWEYIWPSGIGPRVAKPRADEDRPVPLVGALRGRDPQKEMIASTCLVLQRTTRGAGSTAGGGG